MDMESSSGSTNIARVGYDDEVGIMEVEFRNGGVYRYMCSRDVFEGFKANGFRGGYFHRNIRSLYEGEKRK